MGAEILAGIIFGESIILADLMLVEYGGLAILADLMLAD